MQFRKDNRPKALVEAYEKASNDLLSFNVFHFLHHFRLYRC